MRAIVSNPHPRVLVDGTAELREQHGATVGKYSGTIRTTMVEEPRWDSWDAIVVLGDVSLPIPWKSKIKIIQIGGSNPAGAWRSGNSSEYRLSLYKEPGNELSIPPGVDDNLFELIFKKLVPLLPEDSLSRQVLHRRANTQKWDPLLVNADGLPVAAIYRPEGRGGEVWYFPAEALDIIDLILRAAFGRWNEEDPTKFPGSPKWTDVSRWMSAEYEDRFLSAEKEIIHARKKIEELEKIIEAREMELEELRNDVVLTPQRRLLTDEGSSLVDAVTYALEKIGFSITDLDAQVADGEPKTGDLLAMDEDWSAMVEIKGYSKGAKSNDLMGVQRHRRVCEGRYGVVQRMWYIANSFRNNSPESRPRMLDGADEYIKEFEKDGGMVVDTRDLFDLLKEVEKGDLSPEGARTTLKGQLGRFIFG